jgi:uncharacterized protein DUF5605/GFO/IDH/MocA oxidoreductase family protein
MTGLKGELIGCGFSASNYLQAWREIEGADIVEGCDLEKARAQECAREFGVGAVYEDADEMLRTEPLAFVDIVSGPTAHRPYGGLAAQQKGNRYRGEILDTREMEITPIQETLEDEWTVELPGNPYMAVQLRKFEANSVLREV